MGWVNDTEDELREVRDALADALVEERHVDAIMAKLEISQWSTDFDAGRCDSG